MTAYTAVALQPDQRQSHYKEKVIALLSRVTAVSVETQKIVEAMRKAQH